MVKKDTLQFGIGIPQMFQKGEVDLSSITDFLSRAESLGYQSAWVMDRVVGGIPNLDPIPLLSYAAGFTSRLKLGTSVMLTALRNPLNLAKSLTTIDQLSGGRLILGAGLGGRRDFYPAFGISSKGRAARFEEGIQLVKKLWTEDEVTFHGRFWQMDNLSLSLKPVQKPHPPIWFGAGSVRALKRAVRMGDGWMGAGNSSTKSFKEELKIIRQCLDEEGRDPETFALSKRVYVMIDRDKNRASERIREWYGQHYGDSDKGLEVFVFGSEGECVEGFGEVASEGIDLLMLNPICEAAEQAERLAKDVLPKL